jgi:hypothetical protein
MINVLYWKYSEENNIHECVEKLRAIKPKQNLCTKCQRPSHKFLNMEAFLKTLFN